MSERCVTMIQQGARRNYVYARLLEEAGLLARLATDGAYAETSRGLVARVLAARGHTRRRVVGVPPERLMASLLPNLFSAAVRPFFHEERCYKWVDEAMALALALRRAPKTDVVVNYHYNGGSFLERCRKAGATILTDFVITPKYLEIEARERKLWPGWEEDRTSPAVIAYYRARMTRLVAISDLYLCPSETVARDLADLPGFDPAKVRLVPYGASDVLLRPGAVEPGRVLFSGAAGLRKGLPYLAEAARLLKQTHPHVEIVVAGAASDAVRNRPETAALTFLGHLDRESMAREFGRADVYCLPSLAEGSATSVYEALANGLPVVTTASSGSVVADGVEGRIVPERDGRALAQAIGAIVADRAMRARLSQAARAAAARYSDERCAARFLDVVREAIDARSRRGRRQEG